MSYDFNAYLKAPPDFNPEDVAPPPLKGGRWPVTSLALDVSGSCNLVCRYCAEAATLPPRPPMTMDTFKEAWNSFFPIGSNRKNVSLRLGSGEPLLSYSLLKEIAEFHEVHNLRPDVFLTTNGTLIDAEIGDWLIDSGWHVKISLDGPEHVHDSWRVGVGNSKTFSIVKKVIERFAAEIPDRLSVTAVLCRESDPQVVFDTIADLGVRRIELVPVAHSDESILPDTADLQRYAEFVQEHAALYFANDQDQLPHLIRFENKVTRVLGYDNNRIHCGAGRSFLGVGSDGDIYPCFRFIGIPSFRLGNVLQGLDTQAIDAFSSGVGCAYDLLTQCQTCWAAPLCGGPCFAISATFGIQKDIVPKLYCAYTLADSRAAVWLVEKLRKSNPERLLSFLPKSIFEFYETQSLSS